MRSAPVGPYADGGCQLPRWSIHHASSIALLIKVMSCCHPGGLIVSAGDVSSGVALVCGYDILLANGLCLSSSHVLYSDIHCDWVLRFLFLNSNLEDGNAQH